MATKLLKASVRERVGKGAARALRREDKIPAVIYGDKKPPVGIALDQNEMTRLLHGGGFMTTIFDIEVDGASERVIPRDFQVEPVRDFLIHVDFLRIAEGAVIAIDIPVHFRDHEQSPGIKRGGVLNVVRHTVELYVPADRIPEFLDASLAGLDIHDSLHISAITLPEGARPVIADRDFTVATIAAPSVGERAAAGAGAGEGAAETPAAS
jgi:large subunit ribosomal protein L25